LRGKVIPTTHILYDFYEQSVSSYEVKSDEAWYSQES
jgi:hypothetical protein